MEFSWWAALYAQLGAPHPRLSLLVVATLFALLGGGCWGLIGADYRRQVADRQSSVQQTDAVARQQISESGVRIAGLETKFEQIEREITERAKKEEQESQRRRKERQQVGELLEAGNRIRAAAESLEEHSGLDQEAVKWNKATYDALLRIDAAYAAQFQSASGPTYSRSIGGKPLPTVNNNVWNFVNIRTDVLAHILESIPN